MGREVFGFLHAKLLHQLLLLGWSRFSRRQTLIQHWRGLRRNRLPVVKRRSEDVGLVRQQHFCPFDLPQVEQHLGHLLTRPAKLIPVGVLLQKVTEVLRLVYDPFQQLLFLGLEWQLRNLILPLQ